MSESRDAITPADIARWESKVDKSTEPDGCWRWTGALNKKGYPLFNGGKSGFRVAHRFAYAVVQPIPAGAIIRHCCPGAHTHETRRCVRPDHLAPGDCKQNAADRREHGGYPHTVGERNGNKKLSDEEVREIFASSDTQAVIAERYGITQPHVSDIKNGYMRAEATGLERKRRPVYDHSGRRQFNIEEPVTTDEGQRFDKFVVPAESGCWLWTGATDEAGYGLFNFRGRAFGAHRFAYLRVHGKFDPALDVAHECSTNLCVRPEHLRERTRAGNMSNEQTLARSAAAQLGNRNRAILTDEQIRTIKQRFVADPDANSTALGEELGVLPAVVVRVRTGQTGGHVVVEGFEPIVSASRSAAAKGRRRQNTAKLGATLEERLAKADEIRAQRASGELVTMIAAANGISDRHVRDICNGKTLVRG